MKFYTAKIIYYNEIDDDMVTDYICVAGEDFVDTMKTIENYYGDTLGTVEIDLINDGHPLVVLPNYATYEVIKKEGNV